MRIEKFVIPLKADWRICRVL